MPDISADNPELPGEDVPTARDTRVEGDLRVARDLRITRDLHVDGDVVGHDKVVHGYSAEQVQRLIADLAAQYQPRPFDGRCPYPGLESFRESEADLFFGREPLVVELCQRVSASSALVVTGPSGNGKSSLVQAGLIPALKAADARGNSRYASITPGRSPLQALGRALAGLTHSLEAEDDFGRHALADDTRLTRWLNITSADQPAQQVVLVVDQFEEVFAQSISEDERRAFIAQLSTAAEQAATVLRLVLVVRSDFIGACARYPHLNRLLSANLIQIEDLGPSELLRAISVPALRVGLRLDPELVSRIIADVRDAPGAMPLMQFALRDLFEAECGSNGVSSLTLEAYLRRGGLHEALRRHADAVFAALTVEQQVLARDILTGLVSAGQGENAPLTRHTARLSELPGPREAVAVVVGKLSAGRLLTVTGREGVATDGPIGESTATLAHETLLEAWPLLVNLVGERRELIRLRSTVIDDATEWNGHGRDLSYLYSGARLAQVLEAMRSANLKVTDSASDFLEAAQAREQELVKMAEANRNAELVRERRVASQLRTRNRWITVAALLAVVASVAALWYAVTAQAQSQTSLALALAAQASEILKTDPGQAVKAALVAIESLRRSPSLSANQTLSQALFLLPQERSRMTHSLDVSAVAFSPDGQWVVSGGADGTARVWSAVTGQERARMTHEQGVTSIAFSPDGKWVVSGSLDGTARVWSAVTGQERARMTHEQGITSVAFSPDGQWVVSGSFDNTARVWSAITGQERARITHSESKRGGAGSVTCVAFNPDGGLVVSGGADGTARVWSAVTGQERARMTHEAGVMSVAFSPDGQWVVSGSWDKTARVWASTTGQERARMTHEDIVIDARFSSRGNWVVSSSYDHSARVWAANSGKELSRVIHDDVVYEAVFSPDDAWVVSGSEDKTARLWSASSGQERARMTGNSGVGAVSISPNGAMVISGSSDGVAKLWSYATGQERIRMNVGSEVTDVAFGPFGEWVVSGDSQGAARIWAAATGQEFVRMTLKGELLDVAFSPGGEWVATGGSDGTARIWATSSGQELARMTLATNRLSMPSRVTSVDFSPDQKWLVTGSDNAIVQVWSTATGQEQARATFDGGVSGVAVSPDGLWVLSGSRDGTARVWSAVTGQERSHILHENAVHAVAYSPDGLSVASVGRDGTIRIWSPATGLERVRVTFDLIQDGFADVIAFSPDSAWVVTGHSEGVIHELSAATGRERVRMALDGSVTDIAFSPDGKWLVSGSTDGTARLWAADTGQERARMTHEGSVNAVAFSPSGDWIVSGSSDGTARIWLWRDSDLITLACERIGKNLTQVDWQRYLPNQPYRKTCEQWPNGD